MSSAESRRRGRSQRSGGVAFSGLPGSGRQTDFPLRILVQSDMVGAIIGRQGSTIRQITQVSRARVDVHRKDNVGSLEKAITIYGNPDNCTNACKKILEVMQQEANNTNKGYGEELYSDDYNSNYEFLNCRSMSVKFSAIVDGCVCKLFIHVISAWPINVFVTLDLLMSRQARELY